VDGEGVQLLLLLLLNISGIALDLSGGVALHIFAKQMCKRPPHQSRPSALCTDMQLQSGIMLTIVDDYLMAVVWFGHVTHCTVSVL
jgi:hypothetical protein